MNRKSRIVTPYGATRNLGEPYSGPTPEEVKTMRHEGLSKMWEHYGELLTKSDIKNKEQKAAMAFAKGAEYLRQVIAVVEKMVEDGEPNASQ
jgi:hypothetical protein